MDIVIDYSRDNLIDPYAMRILKDRYLMPEEKSPQDAFARAAKAFADDQAHAQRLYDYVSKQWFMFATPVLANGGTSRGLPISCFLSAVGDSLEGIIDHESESSWLAAMGGGLGAGWSFLRTNKTKTSRGGESTGAIPFIVQFDRKVLAYKQAGTRRAAYAAYLSVSHPEIMEFINIRKPTGGAVERKALNIHNAVSVPDSFMEKLFVKDDRWELKDPHTGVVTDTVSARELWSKLLMLRIETGEPYFFFIDNANKALPEEQKRLGLRINTSNLCNEIYLPTDEQRTAVCCLSSVNLAKFDEWRNTSMVYDLIKMLDNVIDAFIQAPHLKPSARHAIRKALYSASRERSLGLGAMGFHSYLQNKLIPFESEEASRINVEMFSYIREQAEDATYDIAVSKGSCPDYIEGKGMQWRRNMHLIAVAPNASSSILCGNVSPGIEPFSAVSFSQKTENGTHVFKHPKFLEILQEKGLSEKDIKSVWRSVGSKKGSVQHLDILADEEKSVFKTAFELDQMWVIRHAADRQKYIDQGQSVNLFFINPVDVSYLHNTHYEAWKRGLKGLYYCRNKIEFSIEDIGQKIERQHLLTEDKTSATNEVKQTKLKTTTHTGFEIECVGCEA
jgi:ribonucleoside-diphosphate reductase alpha chain